jgi:hypothetical protein
MKIKKNAFFSILIMPFLLVLLFIPAQSVFAEQLPGTSSAVSFNWSGYVATEGNYTAVGASWIVPQITATNQNFSADATWVGIGGLSTTDLIQAGTQAIVQNGTTTYEAWYELLPLASTQVPLAVHSGDDMTVSIAQQSSGQWKIYFIDATTGQSYQASVSYNSSLSSAEWIEEMPSDQKGMVALDNFGTLSFANAFAVQDNGSPETISALGAQPMTMITNTDQALATPSTLGADGASFSVTRSSATVSAQNMIPGGRWSRVGIGVQNYVPSPTSHQTQSRQTGMGGNGFFPRRLTVLFGGFGNHARAMF